MSAAQEWERSWWDLCQWTLNEELKQIVYARKMGLGDPYSDYMGRWPIWDLRGRSVVDIGGGPASLLLKCVDVINPTVIDPCEFPQWVYQRYAECGIGVRAIPAEDADEPEWVSWPYDEAWIYNVLQHVNDPETVVKNARRMGKTVRIFDWIEIPPHEGHPHMLTAGQLDEWFGSKGFVQYLNESGCVGKAYYGAFEQV